MTTDTKDTEQARKALHKAEKEYCSNFDNGPVFIWADKGTVFHWAERGAYMLKADAQAEIARLREERDRFEAALGRACQVGGTTYLVERAEKAEAERDAALAQVAGAYEEAATEAAVEVAAHGASELAPFLRRKIRALTPADALAALSRRDAQMRAEGMRRALNVVSENADWPEDEHGRTEHPALFARISHAILAAAEKEKGNG